MKKNILFIICALSLGGCASLHSVSLTPIPANRGKVVTAEVSKFIFLGFNFDNDYVDMLTGQLKQKCPGGVISGILTKDESVSYFIAHTRKVSATGFCGNLVGQNGGNKRTTASDDGEEM